MELEAQVFDCPPTIVLRWRRLQASSTGSFQIFRRLPHELHALTPVVVVPANTTDFTDTNVTIGVAYEYLVIATPQSNPITPGGGLGLPQGYIRSGIAIPTVRKRGSILIVVERELQTALAALPREQGSLDMLTADLVAEGWKPTIIAVNATDSVVSVKAAITSAYRADANLRTLYLLGQVPYPYSGNQAPDGHSDHQGAWPSDGFYGEIDYPATMWTDTGNFSAPTVNSRIRNWPGDGKYDDLMFLTPLELQVGRVDLSRIDVFATPFKSEVNLTARYILKSHQFRTTERTYGRMSLLRVHFDNFLSGKSPVRFLRPFFGDFPVLDASELLEILSNTSSLISAGDGPGSYSSVFGIGNAAAFARLNPRCAVLPLFGSYFGDTDSTNNLLRIAIATEHVLLTWWHSWPGFQSAHQMALGATSGEMANASLSRFTSDQNRQTFPEGGNSGSPSAGRVYVSLVGDPTLRLFNVPQPTVVADSTTCGTIKLSLTDNKPKSDDDPDAAPAHSFEILDVNWNLVASVKSVNRAATYNHAVPAGGAVSLLVRAVRLETTLSGTFFTPSLAVTVSATTTVCGTRSTTTTTTTTTSTTTTKPPTTTTTKAPPTSTTTTKPPTSSTATTTTTKSPTSSTATTTTTKSPTSTTTTAASGSATAVATASDSIATSSDSIAASSDSNVASSDPIAASTDSTAPVESTADASTTDSTDEVIITAPDVVSAAMQASFSAMLLATTITMTMLQVV